MKKFTVIGFYEETGQTFAHHVKGRDPHDAIRIAVAGFINMSDSSDVAVLGAIPGHVQLTASAEDSGNLAYACDLAQDMCELCGEPADDGEGWDGLCGSCADKKERAS